MDDRLSEITDQLEKNSITLEDYMRELIKLTETAIDQNSLLLSELQEIKSVVNAPDYVGDAADAATLFDLYNKARR